MILNKYVFYWISEDTLIELPMDEAVSYWSKRVVNFEEFVAIELDDLVCLGEL